MESFALARRSPGAWSCGVNMPRPREGAAHLQTAALKCLAGHIRPEGAGTAPPGPRQREVSYEVNESYLAITFGSPLQNLSTSCPKGPAHQTSRSCCVREDRTDALYLPIISKSPVTSLLLFHVWDHKGSGNSQGTQGFLPTDSSSILL